MLLAAVALMVGVFGVAPAQAQIVADVLEPVPVPGSAPPENYVEAKPFPRAPSVPGGSSGETVRRFSEGEMEEYFDGRAADVTFESPECSWRDRVCYGYISVDALYWDRVRSGNGTIATNATTGGVNFNAKSFVWNDWVALPRISAGYVFDNGYALESSYLYTDSLNTSNGVYNPANVNMVMFGTPSAAFAPNFFEADMLNASSSVALQSGELNVRETNGYLNFLWGFRWFEMQDRLRIRVQKGATISNADIFTYNDLFGGQVGVHLNQHVGIFGLEAFAKAGMFLNVGRSHTQTINAGTGLADQNRSAHGNSEAFMAEAQIMATYNPYIWLQARIGYQAFMMQQTSLAVDQIRQNNTTGLSLVERSDLIYHGPFGGVELRW
jgi:hypothetical protein